jgi:hypothetical protein
VVSTGIPQYYVGHIKKSAKKPVFFNEVYRDLKFNLKVQEGMISSRE